MAHGGSDAWNRSVSDAVEPLRSELPAVIAYGMANPTTLEAGLDSLRSIGVERVALVRLFVSGQSFLEQTEYLVGLRSDRPSNMFLMRGDPATIRPIDHGMDLATHSVGLMVSAEAQSILADRASRVSRDRGSESVLLLAHGMGDEAQNDRVLDAMAEVAIQLEEAGFAKAAAATLREDWAEKREVAEAAIREFVTNETAVGRDVIVVPMRLSGFGPYAEVLAGLDYVAADGLLPHPEITNWIRARATEVACSQGWEHRSLPCGALVASPTETKSAR